VGSLWCTLFDASWDAPVAWKETRPPAELGVAAGEHLHIGDARLAPGLAESPRWRLTFEGDDQPFPYLPRGWMYRAKLPRTKAESLYPQVRFSGRVENDGRVMELDGWPGMIGHNWGAEHAERWIWLHGVFDDGAWLDMPLGRVKLGPLLTPWIANGALCVDGERRRLRGFARVDESARGGTIAVGGVRVEVAAPQVVSWIYADPSGGEHRSTNCSIARVELSAGGRTLRTEHGGAWELGTREAPPGVEAQPYPDP